MYVCMYVCMCVCVYIYIYIYIYIYVPSQQLSNKFVKECTKGKVLFPSSYFVLQTLDGFVYNKELFLKTFIVVTQI